MLNKQVFPPESIRKTPLCMDQYKKIFGTTRIPGEKCDSLIHQYPTTSNHIIVLCRDIIYQVPVLSQKGKRISIHEIERLLLEVGRLSLESITTKKPTPIGVLTAGHRDDWYKGLKRENFLRSQLILRSILQAFGNIT
jgi:carnitine O-acetyltransferase